MKLLTLQEYKEKVDEFYQKHDEYLHEIATINVAENKYCDTLTKEQEDAYFEEDENGRLINDIARGYEEQRKAVKEKYKGYEDFYGSDFGTILNEDAIELFNYGITAQDLLMKANDRVGQRFYDTYGGVTKIYTFRYIVITPDDFSWAGETDDGEWLYYSCVGSPHWIE